MALLELLTRQGGFDPRDLADLLGEGGGEFAELLQQVLGGGANLNDLLGQVDVNDLMTILNGGGGGDREGGRGSRDRGGRRGRGEWGEGNAEGEERLDLRERLNRRRGGEEEPDANPDEEVR